VDPWGLGPPSPAVRRTAGEGGERSETGEGPLPRCKFWETAHAI